MAADGSLLCALCDQPNDPDHPKSAYCQKHRREVSSQAERDSRARAKAARELTNPVDPAPQHWISEGFYSGPAGIVLRDGMDDEFRRVVGALLSVAAEARSVTSDFRAGSDADFYLVHLRAVVTAVEDLNEVVGPALRRRAQRAADGT